MSNESISPSSVASPQLEVLDDEKIRQLAKPNQTGAQAFAAPAGELNVQLIVDKPESISYTRADGTIETAVNPADAIRRCPVLGKMPLEQAKVLLELQAMDTKTTRPEPTEDKQGAAISNQSYKISTTPEKRSSEKTPDVHKADQPDKSASSLIEVAATVNAGTAERAIPAEKADTVSETAIHNLQGQTQNEPNIRPKTAAQLEAPGKLELVVKELTPKVPAAAAYSESAVRHISNKTKIDEIVPIPHSIEQTIQYDEAAAHASLLDKDYINSPEIVFHELPNTLKTEQVAVRVLDLDNADVLDTDYMGVSKDDIAGDAPDSIDHTTKLGAAEKTDGVKDEPESEPKDLSEEGSTGDLWQADDTNNGEFEAPEANTIHVNSETSGMVETIVREDIAQTHRQLLEIIRDVAETQPIVGQIDTEPEELAEAAGSTEEPAPQNIVEIIRSEAAIAEEPATMEQVKADAQDAQPLEQALAKLSIVLESSSGQSDEPVIKLLAEIAERILAEPAQSKEGMIDNQPVAITPEITQLFINLLEELGYEDPHHTLVSFVSQYGIDELINTAVYLHQLAESGDQKEYLSGRLPAISSDSPTLPLSTLIGKTIFQIIKPELHTLALAA